MLPAKFIKELLHKNISGYSVPRSTVPLHASDITNDTKEFCPREYALVDKHKLIYPKEFVGTSMRITWEYGRFIEYNVRNTWLRDYVYGNWLCRSCDHMWPISTVDSHDTLVACPWCGTCLWDYAEIPFCSSSSGISGSPDCLVLDPYDKHLLHIVELKTIDKDYYRELTVPKPEHTIRTNLYMRVIDDNDSVQLGEYRINTQYAYLLYFSKSFGYADKEIANYDFYDARFSPIKEYVVERNDTLTQSYWQKALDFRRYQEYSIVPERICDTATCTRAKHCIAQVQCFSGVA